MNIDDLIAVGEIVKSQGVQGEVKVLPLTDDPSRFGKLTRVFLKNSAGIIKELQIEGYRPFRQFILLKFAGINDMNAADALGRGLICIPRQERPKLPEGHYYQDEIEGLQVYTLSGDFLGKIVQILETGANDIYVVQDERREILIPALKDIIREINLPQSLMVVELPEGLVEND